MKRDLEIIRQILQSAKTLNSAHQFINPLIYFRSRRAQSYG